MGPGLVSKAEYIIAASDFVIFVIVFVDEGLSNLRSSSIDNRESDDLPKSPKVLIDKLVTLMVEK